MSLPPILDNKHPDAPSVFEPAALLREARRQKSQAVITVPPVCILDPDCDIVRRLKRSGIAKRIEMEAAALYTFARKRNKAFLCLAHVTNTMGIADQDFENGEADGTADPLMILDAVAKVLRVEVSSETITCPKCGHRANEQMPTDACRYFYDCNFCRERLKAHPRRLLRLLLLWHR